MPKVKVQSQTSLSPKDAFDKISNLLNNDQELRKLDPSYKCQFDSGALSGTATGTHFKADMLIIPIASGSDVSITIELPFHLALVKGLVEKTLQKKLAATLG